MPRTREWKNETIILSPAANTQVATEFATGLTIKGATLQRIIVQLAVTPVTVDVNTIIHFAIWPGPAGGEPANIHVADNASYLYWTSFPMALAVAIPGATERFQYRQFDVRGQRVFRSDFDGLWMLARSDAASAVNYYVGVRTLMLLP